MFSCFSQPATGQNDQGQQGPGQLDGLYGFPAPDGLTDAQLADRQHSSASASASAAAWSRLAINKDGIPQLPSSRSQLKKLCRGGIPPHLRAKVWPLISGASKLRQAKGAAYFQQMLQEAERVERLQGTEDGQDKKLHNAIKQIDLDVPRTFSQHAWLKSEDGQRRLRRALCALAAHAPSIGYCQGLNFVAGVLLCVQEHDEETVFFMLAAIVEGRLYEGTYEANLFGCQVEMKALARLLQAQRPALAEHLARIGCEMCFLSTDWYVCLHSTTLPLSTCLRVWDSLLLEGSKVLHRVALSLLRLCEAELRRQDNAGEAIRCIKDFTASCTSAEVLMHTAFKRLGGLPLSRLHRLRTQEAVAVQEMLGKRGGKS